MTKNSRLFAATSTTCSTLLPSCVVKLLLTPINTQYGSVRADSSSSRQYLRHKLRDGHIQGTHNKLLVHSIAVRLCPLKNGFFFRAQVN